MRSRWLDLLLLFGLAAGLAWWLVGKPQQSAPTVPPTAAAPTPGTLATRTETPAAGPDSAQRIWYGTADPDYDSLMWTDLPPEAPDPHPLMVIMHAPGCRECVERIESDREAFRMAQEHGIPLHYLFYGTLEQAKSSFSALRPKAEMFVADPTGELVIRRYHGNDRACWVLIGDQGEVVFQAGADLAGLQAAMDRLRPQTETEGRTE